MKIIKILFEEASENYHGSQEEKEALLKIEELRLKFAKQYSEAMDNLFSQLESLYYSIVDSSMRNFFEFGFKKGFLLSKEIKL